MKKLKFMSCNPAGYYSLRLSDSAEKLITSLDYQNTLEFLCDVVFFISEEEVDRFYAMSMSLVKWFEDEIDDLSIADKISLIRWLGERLAWMKSQEKANDGKP